MSCSCSFLHSILQSLEGCSLQAVMVDGYSQLCLTATASYDGRQQPLTWWLFLLQQRTRDNAAMSPAMSAGLACSCLSRKLCTQVRLSAAMLSCRLAAAVSRRVAPKGGSSCKHQVRRAEGY
jgi:hypothetical protein